MAFGVRVASGSGTLARRRGGGGVSFGRSSVTAGERFNSQPRERLTLYGHFFPIFFYVA